jgi:uncharacterized protein
MKKEELNMNGSLKERHRFVQMKLPFKIFVFLLLLVPMGSLGQYVKYTYPNGAVSSEGMMVEGKPEGYWKTYYPDGGLKTEGNRKNFKLDSVWIFYRDDSTMERRITYREDVKHGVEVIYNKRGSVQEEWSNENGIKSGLVKYYYETGELWKEVTFENNKEEGKGIEYAIDGRIISFFIFKNGFVYNHERVNRYNENGKRTGIWQEYYGIGQMKEEGNYTNGMRNGVFKYFERNGKLSLIQQYVDDVLVEGENATALPDIRQEYYADGQLKTSGSYKNGKRHGTFRTYDPRGNEDIAIMFEQDIKAAEGRIDSLGRRYGAWKLLYPSGSVKAEGAYKEGLREGNWTYYEPNGEKSQTGSYLKDLPVGNWKWYYSKSRLHRDEYYLRGKEDGHCVEYDTLGQVLTEGDFTNGRRVGAWILHVNDHQEEGAYEDGELNGLWTWKYADGSKAFQGEYAVGLPIGKHKYWYPNGQMKMKGEYEGGELSGRWDYYEADGTLTLQLEYEAGVVTKINGNKIKLPQTTEE